MTRYHRQAGDLPNPEDFYRRWVNARSADECTEDGLTDALLDFEQDCPELDDVDAWNDFVQEVLDLYVDDHPN